MDYLVVGLGNIGAEYASTRHNMGFMVLDAWAQASNAVFNVERYGSIAEISFKGRNLTLLKPSTYMNLSGNAVRYWMRKLNLPLEQLLVICDDFNLPFGTVRLRKSGSSGGHNGLENISFLLESQDYSRIRIGIGNSFPKGSEIDFVIGAFNEEERRAIPDICDKGIEGIKSFVTIGPDRTMNILNTRIKKEMQG